MPSGGAPNGRVPELPPGWAVRERSGPFGFITAQVLLAPDGTELTWTSRRHRKALGLRPSDGITPPAGVRQPSPMSRWLASLFGLGALCFAVASLPVYFDAVSAALTAWTFAVGSVLFTAAAFLQFHESATSPAGLLAAPRRRLGKLLHWHPHRIDWWAGGVQLVGTVLFNVSTFAAALGDLDFDREKHLVWGPDVAGSVCFLLASWLAYAEVNPGVLPRSDHSVGWRISVLNLAGSLAFGAAAVGARLLPTTGEPTNVALVNGATFAGAVCFLAGAVLLPVESRRDTARRGG